MLLVRAASAGLLILGAVEAMATTVILTSYLDGKKVSQVKTTTDVISVVPNAFDMVIGGQLGHTPRRWLGGIDDIRIWNVARSAEDIANSFDRVADTSDTDLVFSLDFELFSEGSFRDVQGGLVATVHGGVTQIENSSISGGYKGIELDGTGYLVVQVPGESPLNLTGSYTLEAWIRMLNWADGDWNTVFAKNFSHPSSNNSFGIARLGGEDALSIVTWANREAEMHAMKVVDEVKISGGGFRDGEWHHVAFTLQIGPEYVAPIPLPATAPMLVASLGALGLMVRRRKKAVSIQVT